MRHGLLYSRCCYDDVSVCSVAGESFYMCDNCQLGCDTLSAITLGSDEYDAGSSPQTSRVIG